MFEAAVESASFRNEEESFEPSISLVLFGALWEFNEPCMFPALVGEGTPN